MTATDKIGAAVKLYHLSREMSQENLAALTGCKRSNISRLENGFRVPNLDTLDRLAIAMGTQGWRILRQANRMAREYEKCGSTVETDGI